MMVISGKSFVYSSMCNFPRQFLTQNNKKSATISAKKRKFSENSESTKKPLIQFKISGKLFAQSAIAVLGLGFVDAGYSGDWSRIGVISKEIEDVLKIAAFVVVPQCFFLVFWLSKNPENQNSNL